jgi:ribokinase
VIIKMGKNGAFVAAADNIQRMVPAFKVKVVDSTAAGDAFNGGLAVALLRGAGLDEAVRFAGAVAALSVTRAGAQPAMPTSDEVTKFITDHSKKKLAK